MDIKKQKATECLNLIISNQFQQAAENFSQAYLSHPEHWPFLCGLICCHILCGESEALLTLLKQEQTASPHRQIIRGLLGFIRRQPSYSTLPPYQTLYNTALFLQKNYARADISILLKAGEIIRPGDIYNLTILGQQAVLKGDYIRGLQYYNQAARLNHNI